MENDIKKVVCVSCGSPDRTPFSRRGNFQYYKCLHCKTISLYEVPKTYSDIYEAEYFKGGSDGFGYVNYDEDKEPMRESFKKYLKLIDNLSSKNGELYDVGAATGFFMGLAKEQGFLVSGVEISDYAAGEARKKGFDVKTGVIEKGDKKDDSIDVVTMLDVVEHMPDPELNINLSHSMLKSGGLLVINTPDSGSFYSKMMRGKWHLLIPPEHIHLFNKKSIKLILERQGFEVLMQIHIGKKFTIEYIFNMLFKWLKLEIFQKIAIYLKGTNIGRFALPLDFRDNMFVIARKK